MENNILEINQVIEGVGDNIGRDKNVFMFGEFDYSADIAISILIGSWDESKEDDIKFIEFVTDEKYEKWIRKIRSIESVKNSPLKHDSGKWIVSNRLETWDSVASRLFNDHLDRFKESSILLLSTLDPKFDLKPEERFAASIHGKVQAHSGLIRKGISEGLALVSTKTNSLVNCSDSYGEIVAARVVGEIFNSSDWKLWASTKDIQSVMAEASPDIFLDMVEAAVDNIEKPFNVLFSQEGTGFSGDNYMTGLLWAFEKLAWSPDYLTRCIVLLGELDSHDPGGNWANRPINSIVDILLPWYPQTTANFEMRFASIKALEREFPKTAWKVLLQLLPSPHGSTSGTSKPEWRSFISSDYKDEYNDTEYNHQIIEYSNYVIFISEKDFLKLPDLVDHLQYFSIDIFNASFNIFQKFSKTNASCVDKYSLWINLLDFINTHRKYSEADWALDDDYLEKLSSLLPDLKPLNIELLYRRLFSSGILDLCEEKGDIIEQEKAITVIRNDAVLELFNKGGYELIYDFSGTVESPSTVGSSLSSIVNEENEIFILDLLSRVDQSSIQFISGYIWGRNFKTKGAFIEKINLNQWKPADVSNFLMFLPFKAQTWKLVETHLGLDFEYLYWNKVHVVSYQCNDDSDRYIGADKLLKYERPIDSIHCLHHILRNQKIVEVGSTIRALLDLVKKKETLSTMDIYAVKGLLGYIISCVEMKDDDRFRIEWAYLPLITDKENTDFSPHYLTRKLVQEPSFFCEIVGLAYRSDKEGSEAKWTEMQMNTKTNARKLLNEWNVIPGTLEDGSFDPVAFDHWFEEVSTISRESGHSNPVLWVIGRVLIHAPEFSNKLWIHPKLAEFLDQRKLDKLRQSYKETVHNSRGVYWIDPEAKSEIKLSELYRSRADATALLGFDRFSRVLRELSEDYAFQAKSTIKRHSMPREFRYY
jgi:hypothetical protein